MQSLQRIISRVFWRVSLNKKYNLTIATDIKGKGGVSSVLKVLDEAGFYKDTNTKLITSHSNYNNFNLFFQLVTFSFCILKLLYNLVFFNITLVHIHLASRGSYKRKSILTRIVCFFKVKIIIHLHGAEFKEFYNNECDDAKKNHIKNTFNMADKVIVLSTQWLDWIDSILLDKSKGLVVYNAVPELPIFETKVEKHFNFVFLGRLGERKGVADLIFAFSRVLKLHPNARLLLGGDGDLNKYKQIVRDLSIQNEVKFLGWISGNEKLEILKKANSYVLPSYNEGFPMGVLEAMSCKIPVIASRAGGIPDAIKSNEEGILIDAGDTNALVKAMLFSIESPEKVESMQNKAFIKYVENFSPNTVVPQIIKIYKDLGAI